MKFTTIKVTLLFMLLAVTAQAAEKTSFPTKDTPPDYLFLIDTSASFEPYRQTVKNKFYDLINEGLDGRLKDGDTFTIWPFNETVNTRTFPVIEWSEANKGQIAAQLYNYFTETHFIGRNEWTPAQVKTFSAIKSLERLTVIIISDGFRKVEGTPFDDRINSVYQRHAGEFRGVGKPFITTLVSYQGKIVGAAVNTVGEKLHDPTPANLTEEAIAEAKVKAEEERLLAEKAAAAKKVATKKATKTPAINSPVVISATTPKQISASEPVGNVNTLANTISASNPPTAQRIASTENNQVVPKISTPVETPTAGSVAATSAGSAVLAEREPIVESSTHSNANEKLSTVTATPVAAQNDYSNLFLIYGGAFLLMAGLLLFFVLLRFHRPNQHQPSIITQSLHQANR